MPTTNRKYPGVLLASPQSCQSCSVRPHTLYRHFRDEALDIVQDYRLCQTQLPAKRKIFVEGQSGTHAYTLYSGCVAVYKSLPNGKRQILRFALPGDFLGFQSQLDSPMLCSAVALSPVILCAFSRPQLKQFLEQDPNLARELALFNVRESELCHYHLMLTGRQSARERIAFLLLEIYYRSKNRGLVTSPGTIPFPISQEDIADAAGLTTVHVNRTLRQMKESGLVDRAGRSLVLQKRKELSDISSFDRQIFDNH
mgnify:CR=1 FL=1